MTISLSEQEQRFGQSLVDQGKLTREQLDFALGERKKRGLGKSLGNLLVELGYLDERVLVECLGQLFNIPAMTADDISPSAELLKLLPEEMIRKYKIFPVFMVDKELTVALTDPSEFYLIELLRERTRCAIQLVIISNSDFVKLLNRYFAHSDDKGAESILDLQRLASRDEAEEDVKNLEKASQELPVVEVVDKIISQAVLEGASDIHFESTPENLRIRFRIDGVLYETLSLAKTFQSGVVSRLKIVSGLNISERQVPQDGRIQVIVDKREIDMRVSTLPTSYGEKVVLRILDREKAVRPLKQLGFSEKNLAVFNKIITEPYGIILVTGPTGSGKTTTLYSALANVDASKFNVITVEDPVEYHLPKINQVNINTRRGLTFALSLRAILRQDPDIILIGEIRDPETGNIAAEAALTGHLVFSTLHTNDAVSTINRLVEIGVEPYLVAPSIQGVVAQRLVRMICPECRNSYTPASHELETLGLQSIGNDITFYHGKGCKSCSFRGYRGRTGIHELLVVDETIREMIASRASTTALRNYLGTIGFRDMRFDALEKIAAGITTTEEVVRVTRDIQ